MPVRMCMGYVGAGCPSEGTLCHFQGPHRRCLVHGGLLYTQPLPVGQPCPTRVCNPDLPVSSTLSSTSVHVRLGCWKQGPRLGVLETRDGFLLLVGAGRLVGSPLGARRPPLLTLSRWVQAAAGRDPAWERPSVESERVFQKEGAPWPVSSPLCWPINRRRGLSARRGGEASLQSPSGGPSPRPPEAALSKGTSGRPFETAVGWERPGK